MDWQDKYLCSRIERGSYSIAWLIKEIKSMWFLFVHSIFPHRRPTEPNCDLPEINDGSNKTYDICLDIFNQADNRINLLEDKAIKIITYVTALFALESFVLVNFASQIIKYCITVSMLLLLLSIFISFRCVNVKFRKTLFVLDLYSLEEENPKSNFDIAVISRNLLSAAIYNQNVADNTADILKSARNTLALALLVGTIGITLSMVYSDRKPQVVTIQNQVTTSGIEEIVKEQNSLIQSLIEQNRESSKLKKDVELIKQEQQRLMNELQQLKDVAGR